MEVSINGGSPFNGWFIVENALKMDDLGMSMFFRKPPRLELQLSFRSIRIVQGFPDPLDDPRLVGGLVAIFYFPIYWEFHHPNWRTHIFQRGGPTTNQKILQDRGFPEADRLWFCQDLGPLHSDAPWPIWRPSPWWGALLCTDESGVEVFFSLIFILYYTIYLKEQNNYKNNSNSNSPLLLLLIIIAIVFYFLFYIV